VRVVVDYGVRWPIGYLVRTVEHSRSARAAFRYVFLQPPAPTMSIFPIAFYDFGFQSSIGVRMVWGNGFLTPGSKVSIKLGTGGRDWWRADMGVSVAAPYGLRVGADFGIRNRPDQQFFGLGSRTPQRALARYSHSRAAVSVNAGWPQLHAFVASVASAASTSHFSDDPSIEDRVASGRIAELPPGYRQILATRRAGVRLALDSRWNRPADAPPASGVRLDAMLERVRDGEIGSWTHVDATIGAALVLDPVGEYKLDLRARVELIESERDVAVPFLELAGVGGSRDLRGFASGRGRDRSAAALTLDYQWPLAAWLDATAYVGVGNVFGERLSGFHAGALRASFGLGLGLAGLDDDRQIELWAATGTPPLDEDFEATSFRLVLGYSHDY
jgi:outer membrane protein assembly factor BamA